LGDVGGFSGAAVDEHLFQDLKILGCERLVAAQTLQRNVVLMLFEIGSSPWPGNVASSFRV